MISLCCLIRVGKVPPPIPLASTPSAQPSRLPRLPPLSHTQPIRLPTQLRRTHVLFRPTLPRVRLPPSVGLEGPVQVDQRSNLRGNEEQEAPQDSKEDEAHRRFCRCCGHWNVRRGEGWAGVEGWAVELCGVAQGGRGGKVGGGGQAATGWGVGVLEHLSPACIDDDQSKSCCRTVPLA